MQGGGVNLAAGAVAGGGQGQGGASREDDSSGAPPLVKRARLEAKEVKLHDSTTRLVARLEDVVSPLVVKV